MKQPLVTIVIINWNYRKAIENCLKSLEMTRYKNYNVIVIDYHNVDGSFEWVKANYPRIKQIKVNNNYGHPYGINLGWEYARKKFNPKYLCVMDNDIVTIQPEWLNVLIDTMEKDEKIGVIKGKHMFKNGRLQPPYNGAIKNRQYPRNNSQFDFIKEVDCFCNPLSVVRSKVIDKVGYLDERLFYAPDDQDFNNRARAAGFKLVYNGYSKAIHIGSGTAKMPQKDFIFSKQSEGMIIYSLRYETFLQKIDMILKQLVRVFITRKNTSAELRISNLIFYRNFISRLKIYFNSIISALKNYKNIEFENNKLTKWSLQKS